MGGAQDGSRAGVQAVGCGPLSLCPQGPSPSSPSPSSLSLPALPLQTGPLPAPLLAGSVSGAGPRLRQQRRVLPALLGLERIESGTQASRASIPSLTICPWRMSTRKEKEGGLQPAAPSL